MTESDWKKLGTVTLGVASLVMSGTLLAEAPPETRWMLLVGGGFLIGLPVPWEMLRRK